MDRLQDCENLHGHHHHGKMSVDELSALTVTFEGHEHESTSVVSCSLQMKEEHTLPFKILVELLMKAGEALEGAGAFIGHMKALANSAGETASASLTDLSAGSTVQGNTDLSLDSDTQIQIVAIVVDLPLQDAFILFRTSFHAIFS